MDSKASHALARKILDTLSSFLEDRGGADELSLNFDAYSAVQLNSFLDRYQAYYSDEFIVGSVLPERLLTSCTCWMPKPAAWAIPFTLS